MFEYASAVAFRAQDYEPSLQSLLAAEFEVSLPEDPAFCALELTEAWADLVESTGPGPEAISVLTEVDAESLDADGRARYVSAWEANAAWVERQRLTALHALAHPCRADAPSQASEEPVGTGPAVAGAVRDRVTTEVVRLALCTGEVHASRRLDLAHALDTRLPRTGAALAAGRISGYHAQLIAERSATLTVEESAWLEERLFPRATTQSPAQLRRTLGRLLAVARPTDLDRAHAEAVKATDVDFWVEDHGMATLRVHGPAPEVTELWHAVCAEARAQATAARQAGADRLPIGRRRLTALTRCVRRGMDDVQARLTDLGQVSPGDDERGSPDAHDAELMLVRAAVEGEDLALVSEAEHAVEHPDPQLRDRGPEETTDGIDPTNPLRLPPGQPPPRQVNVIIDLPVLLGLRDGIGILDGYGPIPAQVARELATDATWRRVVLDPVDGWLLDYGRTRYRPGPRLRDHLLGVGQSCRAPTCTARPVETDHVRDWAKGGETSAENMAGLCRRSHALKTRDGFTAASRPSASMVWTTPAGTTYVRPPDDLRVTDHGRGDLRA
ncbi:MAG TPA: DUF222 domain-containing protein [Actinomycetes bacterium]|nr:DUF222 domain-containing protein [Actinomycetes bacterium]